MTRKWIQRTALAALFIGLSASLYHITRQPALDLDSEHADQANAQSARPEQATLSDVPQPTPNVTQAESNQPVSQHSELLPINKLTDAAALQVTLKAVQTTQFADLAVYLGQFRSVVNPHYDKSANHYLPAVYKAIIQQMAAIDFDATLEYVLADLRETLTANGFWHQLALNTLAEQEPEYVARSMASSAGAFENAATLSTYNNIAINLNPALTAESALTALTQGEGDAASNEELLTDALNKWMLTDANAALNFVQAKLFDADDLSTRTSDMLHFWLEADPLAAHTTVQQRLDIGLVSEPETYLDLAELHIDQWSKSDPAAAYEWLREKDNELLYQQSMETLLQNWLDSGDVYEIAQLVQIDSRRVNNALSLYDQLDLTEKIILALVETGNQQQANEWLSSQADVTVVEHGKAILQQLAKN